MPEPVAVEIDRECRALCRYLVGIEPSAYVIAKYAHGLDSATFNEGLRDSAADRTLLAVGRLGRTGLSLADVYARFFAPGGSFRRRAVLLGAILETAPASFEAFEPAPAGRLNAWLSLVGAGLQFALRLPLAILLIGPLHLVTRLMGGRTHAANTGR